MLKGRSCGWGFVLYYKRARCVRSGVGVLEFLRGAIMRKQEGFCDDI